MTIYRLYDYYEGKDLIGEYDNWHDLQKAKKEYIADTDGECDLAVEEYDNWEQGVDTYESLCINVLDRWIW